MSAGTFRLTTETQEPPLESASRVIYQWSYAPELDELYNALVHRQPVLHDGRWVERLNTDAAIYGGSNVGNSGTVFAESRGWQGRPASVSLTLPPLSTTILQYEE